FLAQSAAARQDSIQPLHLKYFTPHGVLPPQRRRIISPLGHNRILPRRRATICPYATKRGARQDGLPRSRCPPERLEQELQPELHPAWALANLQDLAERRIREVSIRI